MHINTSPLMVSVYNRELHFKKCIESLKACKFSEKSHLFIAIDAPFRDEDIDANKRIIQYSKEISGFKEITLLIRPENYGAYKNLILAKNEIFSKYNRLIMFEDDNIFSPDFLNFVNKGLNIYQEREDIFSVSGYQYPIIMPPGYKKDIYLWQGFSAWGVGIWKEKWEKVDWEEEKALKSIRQFLKNYKAVYQHQKTANHYFPAILKMVEQNRLHGDGYLSLYQFLNNMYSVFPVTSRVRNMGHDGSGIGCGYMENDIYAQQAIYSRQDDYTFPQNIQNEELLNQVLYQHFKIPLKSKLKAILKLLLFNSGLLKQGTKWPI